MSGFTRAALADDGFTGFVTFEQLRASIEDVPSSGGVYVVVRESLEAPEFLEASRGGWFKKRDPTVDVTRLQGKWIDGCQTVYIGKGDNLRRRLKQYADFGRGKPIGHWGGRYIWQLADQANLLAAWKPCEPEETANEMEARLLRQFKAEHGGRLPFANLVGG